jgi:hypothetical protein
VPRWAVVARWVFRSTRADLLAWLVPRWIALALAVVELDVIVDWGKLARTFRALPAAEVGAGVALAAILAGLDGGRLVRTTLLGPRLATLRRQPVPGREWVAGALVVAVPVAAPLGVLAGMAYAAGLGWVLLWVGVGLVPALAAGGRRRWLGPAGVVAGLVAGAAHATGAPLVWASAAWLAAAAAVGPLTLAWADDRPHAAPPPVPLRPRGPWTAILHRDLLTLWRTERPLVSGALAGAVVVALPTAGMARSGDWAGSAVTAAAVIALALLGPLSLAAVTAVARRLGRRLDPPEWPVTALQRALALAMVGGGALLPGWAAAAVAAPPIGVGHLRIGAFVAAIGAGAAWWVASRPTRPNPGTWPYWLATCLGAALAPGAGFWAFALAGLALHRASRALERRRGGP